MPSGNPSAHDLHDIQGGVIGFNKDLQRLVFLNFPDAVTGKRFLAGVRHLLGTGHEVLDFNHLFKEAVAKRGEPAHDLKATWTNLWLSFSGFQVLGADGLDAFPDDFRAGMAARAQAIGDVGRSAPANWVAPFTGGAIPHAVAVIASDTAEDLQAAYQDFVAVVAEAGITELTPAQEGKTRLPPFRGREHFGFKDGISQPGIRGLTKSSKSHTDVVAAGEFLIGYENEDGQVSGQPSPTPPPPPSSYDPAPPPPLPAPLPRWAHNGSFVVFRRLQQDVGAFRAFVNGPSAGGQLSADQLGAKLVGRWPSGAPMEPVPGEGHSDPSTQDPSVADPAVLDDQHINKFAYDNDPDGLRVPRAAHIRKVNPRSTALPDGDRSNRHRLLRRGIPYGEEFVDTEPAYGQTVPLDQDRGLLFVCYQASIARGFEFVQARWANATTFQQPGDGQDPTISQDNDPRPFHIPMAAGPLELQIAQWVFTTGGGYFFSPSISAIEHLAST
jgi:Dyp-type peroxidase family